MQEGFELPSRTGGRLRFVRSRSATELLSGARIWAEGSAGSTTRFPPRRFLSLLAGTSGPGSGDLRDQLSGPSSVLLSGTTSHLRYGSCGGDGRLRRGPSGSVFGGRNAGGLADLDSVPLGGAGGGA